MAAPAPSKKQSLEDFVFVHRDDYKRMLDEYGRWNKFSTAMEQAIPERQLFLVEVKQALRGKEAEVELLKKMKELVEKSLEVPAPAQ
jgi:hypothetical protein